MAYKGKFSPKNPQKYRGDYTNIVYRSTWECRVMTWLDGNESIIEWSSEEIVIPYKSPVDNRVHRYFPDFYVEVIDKKDPMKFEKLVIEIKPNKETQTPIAPQRQKSSLKMWESYEYQLKTYQKNLYKWTKAKYWCEKNQLKFVILAENHLKQNNIM